MVKNYVRINGGKIQVHDYLILEHTLEQMCPECPLEYLEYFDQIDPGTCTYGEFK